MKERPIIFNAGMVNAILAGRKTQTRRVVPKWQKPKETDGPHDTFPDSRWISVAQRHPRYGFGVFGATEDECMNNYNVEYGGLCPYGQPGDRLWVRESFWGCDLPGYGDQPCVVYDNEWQGKEYKPEKPRPWARKFGRIPSIHMPRDCSRILLEIVSVRVERLLSISDGDAIAEGCYTDDEYSEMAGEADVWPCQICDGYQVHEHGSLAGASEVDCHSCNSPKKRFNQLWQSINGFDSWDANPWVWVVEFKRLEDTDERYQRIAS